MISKLVFGLFSIAILTSSTFAQQTSVLFLGNSYIYTGNLPATLYSLALSGGDTIVHQSNTPGGYTLEGHSTNTTSLGYIANSDWDFVVLQEQSQKPSFPPAQVATETLPYAEILVDSIKSSYECSEPVFFMTWGRRDGDQQNCQFYSPLCTYDGMQQRLRESYLLMAQNNVATASPCGAAWKQVEIADSLLWRSLYSGDGSHPSASGTYLNACVFYSTIFRKTPVGLPYYSTIGQSTAETFQQIAEDVVMDSLSTWFIGHADVVANPSHNVSGGQVTFMNTSENASEHFWDFGDGITSNESEPTHIYPIAGLYDAMYVARSNCDSDTVYFNVNSELQSISENSALTDVQVINTGSGYRIQNNSSETISIELLDIQGRIVRNELIDPTSSETISCSATSGITMLVLRTKAENAVRKLWFD